MKDIKKEGIISNSELTNKMIKKYIKLDEKAQEIMEFAFKKFNFSARSYNKILKLARTIADLADSDLVLEKHVLEAIQYRTLDKKYWR